MKMIFRSVLLSSVLVSSSYSNIPFDTEIIDTSIKNNLWNNIQRSNEIGFLRGKIIVLLGGGIICCIGLIYGLIYRGDHTSSSPSKISSSSDPLRILAKEKLGETNDNGNVSSENFAKAVEELHEGGLKHKIANVLYKFCSENGNKDITIKRYGHENCTGYAFGCTGTGSDNVKVDLYVDSDNDYRLNVHNCLKSDLIKQFFPTVQETSWTVKDFRDKIQDMDLSKCRKTLISDVLNVFDNEDQVWTSRNDKYFLICKSRVYVHIHYDPPQEK